MLVFEIYCYVIFSIAKFIFVDECSFIPDMLPITLLRKYRAILSTKWYIQYR